MPYPGKATRSFDEGQSSTKKMCHIQVRRPEFPTEDNEVLKEKQKKEKNVSYSGRVTQISDEGQ